MFTFSKEKELHEFIIENFNRYFDFKYTSSEFIINGGRIDILGNDDDSIYIVEIKRDIVTKNTMKQLISYIPTIQTMNPNKKVFGIAVAPSIDKNVDINSLPQNVTIKTLEDVHFIEPEHFSTRKRVTFTIEEELVERLKEVSEQTMIPQAKLVEKAIEKVIEEYKN